MKITLFDTNKDICAEWAKEFINYPEVTIANISLEELPYHNYVVTAGNSFAAMSGGIDLAMRGLMGYQLQDYFQLAIMKDWPYGLPVGDMLISNSPDQDRFEYIIYAPTMRVPSFARRLDIAYVVSVIMDFALDNDKATFAIPGLGGGSGALTPKEVAKSMYMGFSTAKYMRTY